MGPKPLFYGLYVKTTHKSGAVQLVWTSEPSSIGRWAHGPTRGLSYENSGSTVFYVLESGLN